MSKNEVYVTTEPRDLELFTDEFEIENVHWIDPKTAAEIADLKLKINVLPRYRGPLIDCQIQPTNSGYRVKMVRPERAITPGQSAVFYQDDRCLGGGIVVAKSPVKSKTRKSPVD